MAFGFSQKYSAEINTVDFNKKQAYLIALEIAQKLNWKVSLYSESGFLAYTQFSMSSWSEEVQVLITDDKINLKSECSGSQLIDWGKNKKNVNAFIEQFKNIDAELHWENLEVRFEEIAEKFEDLDIAIKQSPLSTKEKLSDTLALFKPTEGYFFTPILINLNALVFILMVINGAGFFQPDGESLLQWGANFKPNTLGGEWWRLLSCCFIHIGFIHLFMNMYALLYIGVLLEPFLGKTRYLSAYLLTGIAASSASLYWNDFTISAGASGAIFGMYGVFLAMLTTNLIEKSARNSMLTSIGVFVAYNLLYGTQEGIDNAAHIGGLLSGLLIGYIYYPGLKNFDDSKLKTITIFGASIAALILSAVLLSNTNGSDIAKYEEDMEQFTLLEEKALNLFNLPETTPDYLLMKEIEETGIPSWESNLELLNKAQYYDLPDELHMRTERLIKYCELRIKSFKAIYKAIEEQSNEYDEEIMGYNQEIEDVFSDFEVE